MKPKPKTNKQKPKPNEIKELEVEIRREFGADLDVRGGVLSAMDPHQIELFVLKGENLGDNANGTKSPKIGYSAAAIFDLRILKRLLDFGERLGVTSVRLALSTDKPLYASFDLPEGLTFPESPGYLKFTGAAVRRIDYFLAPRVEYQSQDGGDWTAYDFSGSFFVGGQESLIAEIEKLLSEKKAKAKPEKE